MTAPAFTREQALVWDPLFQLLSLAAPLASAIREVAPIALVEQLRAGGASVDVIGVWAAAVAAAVDATADDIEHWDGLGRHLEVVAPEGAAKRWATAFRGCVFDRNSAQGLLELLLASNQVWRVGERFRGAPPFNDDVS